MIGTPGVRGAKLALSSGNELHIEIMNAGEDKIYVRSARFNGKELPDFILPARELMQGGTLVFEMK